MVPSLVHGVNKTRKHWHCCIFQIVFSIPIYPLQRGFYPLKICLIPLNLKRVVYCFTMGVKNKENRADLPPVSKCSGNPDINSSAFTEFPSKPESRKKNVFIYRPTRSHYNLMFQCTKCQHWFHPECQDIKLKACQLKHSRTVGCFECWLKWKLACSNWVNVINLF